MSLQVVWFKRDLRISDHEALFRASLAGPILCLYVIEPEYWQQGSTSNRQWLFVRESLLDLHEQLEALGAILVVQQGEVQDSLDSIRSTYGRFVLHSHIETGIGWTFKRDRNVAQWCRETEVQWHEYAQNGVCRPVSSRQSGFKAYWDQWVQTPKFARPANAKLVGRDVELRVQSLGPDQWPVSICTDQFDCPGRQEGGRRAGLATFKSFLLERGESYRGSISSPLTAESACSRLSPYLAYGCLGLREVVQRTETAKREATTSRWRKSLTAFMTRLHWHCYWIQSFESDCQMEYEPLVPHMGVLPRTFNQDRFEAWRTGNTGWPMVDASMRYLHNQGWINFRMRAMLVCAATHSLELPWQPVADWMAQMFVDFEPGIHYSQIQLQSAMSGGTVVRMYNPVTQASTLDPNGEFVRRWVPELTRVSQFWILEPWKMTPNLREAAGWTREYFYPAPLVDFAQTQRETKAAISEIRRTHSISQPRRFDGHRSGRDAKAKADLAIKRNQSEITEATTNSPDTFKQEEGPVQQTLF